MDKQDLRSKLWHIKHDKQVEAIVYWSTCLIGGAIGFVLVFAVLDLLLLLNNKI